MTNHPNDPSFKIRDKVEIVLKDIPASRNSDVTLWIWIIKRFYPEAITDSGLIRSDMLHSVPTEGHTTRIRADFQNKKNMYLPTEYEIAKKRRIKELTWKAYINEIKSENIDQLSLIS